jgi:hypothetical protein
VPVPRVLVAFSGAVAIGVSVPVSPRRFAGDVVRCEVVGVCAEHSADLGACPRFEVSLSDKCDDLMTLVAPGGRLSWHKHRRQEGGENLRLEGHVIEAFPT